MTPRRLQHIGRQPLHGLAHQRARLQKMQRRHDEGDGRHEQRATPLDAPDYPDCAIAGILDQPALVDEELRYADQIDCTPNFVAHSQPPCFLGRRSGRVKGHDNTTMELFATGFHRATCGVLS